MSHELENLREIPPQAEAAASYSTISFQLEVAWSPTWKESTSSLAQLRDQLAAKQLCVGYFGVEEAQAGMWAWRQMQIHSLAQRS